MCCTAWGRGYASEAAGALIDDTFEWLGLARVHAWTMAANTRSRGVMKRLGMRLAKTQVTEASSPIPGVEEAESMILRADWRR